MTSTLAEPLLAPCASDGFRCVFGSRRGARLQRPEPRVEQALARLGALMGPLAAHMALEDALLRLSPEDARHTHTPTISSIEVKANGDVWSHGLCARQVLSKEWHRPQGLSEREPWRLTLLLLAGERVQARRASDGVGCNMRATDRDTLACQLAWHLAHDWGDLGTGEDDGGRWPS